MFSFDDFRPQGPEIDALQKQISEHRLVHAVLITGQPGSGKRTLASLVAVSLMCTTGTDIPCGKCEGCRLALAGEHPDITVIEKGNPISPDVQKGRATIPVEDIREMIRLCSRYAFGGGNRVVMIPDAENMTPQAQNSLLKILEEPPRNTFFLMTTSHPEQILTTVRSRCRNIKLIPWDESYIAETLTASGIDQETAAKAARVSGGSIGNAFRLSSDDSYWKMKDEIVKSFFCNRKRSEVLNISTSWKDRKGSADQLFDILEESVRLFLKYRLFNDRKDFPDEYSKEWQRFAESAPLERFSLLTDAIACARKQNASNVNFQAVVEQLLLTFIGECDLWAE
ncbi:MAG: DNA polymerase III subunit delta' [Clostridia bacterium]|nr:DNA polymerase III subunit delta' [Clostridia bacterium]